MRRLATVATATAFVLGAAACGAPSEQAGSGSDTLRVGATAVPAGEVLAFVRDELAADAGLDLKIEEFSDYNAPNAALAEGDLDANLYQHEPFLKDYNANSGSDLVAVGDVYLPPLALYSEQITAVDELADGASVAVPNDATNEYRALLLLQEAGLVTLADDVEESTFSLSDIEDNPKKLDFKELDAAQLPRSLGDVDAAIVNANFALDAGLNADDAILKEEFEGSPYINVLATTADQRDDERIATLAELLTSDEVTEFIEKEYKGTVIPVAAAS
ncbi:D-methionine transport system substrate-binding protein [Murinocardiopsis flavida]|uniref:Lipoprotein n=1 Tax=Murinocardiopsis flavida TaxID=645275 RepID=A0A2P8DES4_9ACTN|nr:MetQ/NlpA family ABC transporter substrate-binding protein [Murinocardiopsis flavida]PSK95689.1 D-methionine transport system substrate-binding protein [Murinocardiopsis flavida]